MRLISVIAFLTIICSVHSQRKFCSVMCKTSGCNGNTMNNCNNQCSNNWVTSGSSCIPDDSKNYYIAASTGDIGLGAALGVSPLGSQSPPCASLYTYGPYTSQTVYITLGPGMTTPYFQLMAYLGILSIDARGGSSSWSSDTCYTLTMLSGSFWQTNLYRLYGPSKVQNEKYC